MKFVILIHSNPEPWGHPTADHLAVFQALPAAERDRLGGLFDDVLAQMQTSGELVGGGALGDPVRPGCCAGRTAPR